MRFVWRKIGQATTRNMWPSKAMRAQFARPALEPRIRAERIRAADLVALRVRDRLLEEQLRRVWIARLVVRVVGAEHHVVVADQLQHGRQEVIVDLGRDEALIAEDLRREPAILLAAILAALRVDAL